MSSIAIYELTKTLKFVKPLPNQPTLPDGFDRSIYTVTEPTVPDELLRKCLQNMTNLRILLFLCPADLSVLDGCTFRLVSFHANFYQSDHLLVRFLHSQPSLVDVTLGLSSNNDIAFAPTCLPNLTRICVANFSWLPQLIPNRPVREVFSGRSGGDGDLSFFTLSAAPIRKLVVDHLCLYPAPVPLLASIFSSLTCLYLCYSAYSESKETVRFINNLFNPNRMITMSVIDSH